MTLRSRPAALTFGLLAACGLAVAGIVYWQSLTSQRPRDLVAHLPANTHTVISVDVGWLRSTGVLNRIAGDRGFEEEDYRRFVDLTDFDYRADLDHVVAGLTPEGTFLLVNGRFAWSQIVGYAGMQGGTCSFGYCRMAASRPDRHISYFALKRSVLGVAISTNPWGARLLDQPRELRWEMPSGRLWAYLRQPSVLAASPLPTLRYAGSLLAGASEAALSLEEESGTMRLTLNAYCPTTSDATAMLARFTSVAQELSRTAGKQAAPGLVPRSLANGEYTVDGPHMRAAWTFDATALEELLGGG